MPRTPEEVLRELAAWPLEERLRLAARILELGAAELEDGRAKGRPGGEQRKAAGPPARPGAAPSGGDAASVAASKPAPARPAAAPGSITPAAGSGSPGGAAPAASAPTTEARRLVVVDGSNFLGTVPGFDLITDSAREELILRLQEFAHAHPSFWIVTYFDGRKSSARRYGRLEIRFTSGQRPADFHILELLRALKAGERRHALLITADRALAEAAHKLGAKIEAPSSFHRRLPGAARKAIGERGLSAAEVADWEAYFQRPPERKKR